MIDYFFLFPNEAAARADANVGAFWINSGPTWDLSTTFPGISVVTPQAVVNGISTLTGFWIIVSRANPVSALDSHANMTMKLDRSLGAVNGNFVIAGASLSSANRANTSFQPIPFGSNYPIPFGQ